MKEENKPIRRIKGFTVKTNVSNSSIVGLLDLANSSSALSIFAFSHPEEIGDQLIFRDNLKKLEKKFQEFFAEFVSDEFKKRTGVELRPEKLSGFSFQNFVSYGYLEVECAYAGDFATSIKVKLIPADGLTIFMRDLIDAKNGITSEKLKTSLMFEKCSSGNH